MKQGQLNDYDSYINHIDIKVYKQQLKLADDDHLVRMDSVSPVQSLMNCDDELHFKSKATKFGNQL